MAKTPQPDESFADMSFPPKGLDLSAGFGAQRDGTTPLGKNVRLFEPSTDRARGGSRPGLAKFIADQPAGTALIQHLNFVVDVDPQALLDGFDALGVANANGFGVTGDAGEGSGVEDDFGYDEDPSSPGPEESWGYDIEYEPDDGTNRRRKVIRITRRSSRIPRRYIRLGGSGRQPSKNSKDARFIKRRPTILWENPGDLIVGFATLNRQHQLNATAVTGILRTPVEGSYKYTPPAGTALGVGNNQQLTVVFKPNNSARYLQATKTVLINVLPVPNPSLSQLGVKIACADPASQACQETPPPLCFKAGSPPPGADANVAAGIWVHEGTCIVS